MEELADYERRFRRAGLPLLIEDYSAGEDIFTRAYPLLALVLFGELFNALNFEWSVLGNIGAVLGGIAVVLGVIALVNRARGRRAFEEPERVGPVELSLFIVLPSLLPLIFGGQETSALVTAAGNILLLLLIYGIVGFGLLSIVRWAGARLVGQLATSLLLLARAIPLLLLFAVVLFVNTEMWQVFAVMADETLAMLMTLLVAIGAGFVAARLPREVTALERGVATGPPLRPIQRFNVGLVMFVSQSLQVLVVCLAVGGFFVVFGVLAIGDPVMDSWLGEADRDELLTLTLFGVEHVLTAELLHVATAIAGFSGLYYAIAILIDSSYREEFLEELTGEMRETFSARAEYLELSAACAPRS